jgi:hypothetical protein
VTVDAACAGRNVLIVLEGQWLGRRGINLREEKDAAHHHHAAKQKDDGNSQRKTRVLADKG